MVGFLAEIEDQPAFAVERAGDGFRGVHGRIAVGRQVEMQAVAEVVDLRAALAGKIIGNARFGQGLAARREGEQQGQRQAQISNPVHMMIPETTRSIRQKPMMSFALSLAMARAGMAQKG